MEPEVAPDVQTPSDGSDRDPRVEYICDRCGFKMHEKNCKVVCSNCGNRFDCSDLNIYFD
jgi:ribosomal protein L37E